MGPFPSFRPSVRQKMAFFSPDREFLIDPTKDLLKSFILKTKNKVERIKRSETQHWLSNHESFAN